MHATIIWHAQDVIYMLDFLLVIPTFNEEAFIREMISSSNRLLSKMYRNYKIVIIDAHSVDSTIDIVKEMSRRIPKVEILESGIRGKRGRDVLYGMHGFNSKLYCYMDADLGPSVSYIKDLVKKQRIGYDVVLASRYSLGSKLRRPPLRKAFSRTYNIMINLIFGDNVTDHQCGFKLFSKKAFNEIYRYSEENHWTWDTETILIAHYKKMRMCEVPIRWSERRNRRTGIIRLLKDVYIFVPSLIRLFYRFRISRSF